MISGSFCYRREADKIYRFFYYTLHRIRRVNPRFETFNEVIDLYAGTGCLSELVLRALAVHGSNGSILTVMLVDHRPWPLIYTLYANWLKQMPIPLSRLRVRFEAPPDAPTELHEIANALNELYKSVRESSVWAARTYFTRTPRFGTVLLRHFYEHSSAKFFVAPAEERIERAMRSRSRNLRKAGIIFLMDPPRSKVKHNYYSSKSAHPERVLQILAAHDAGPIFYINYLGAIKEHIPPGYTIFSRFRLYNSGSASKRELERRRPYIATLVPEEVVKSHGIAPNSPLLLKHKAFVPGVKEELITKGPDPACIRGIKYEWLRKLDYPPYDFRPPRCVKGTKFSLEEWFSEGNT